MVAKHRPCLLDVLHALVLSPAFLAELHDRPYKFRGHHNFRPDYRLFHIFDLRRIGHVGRIGQIHTGAVRLVYLVNNAGCRGHQIQIVFPLQPLLDDLQMEQSQKPAAEAKAQRHRGFRLVKQRCVVELELLQRIPQITVLGAVSRIHAAVHHGINLLVARQRLRTGTLIVRHRIAHPGISHILDAGRDVAHHSGGQLFTGDHLPRAKVAYFHHFLHSAGGHHADLRPPADSPFHHAAGNDDSFIGIVYRIENQGLQGRLRIPRRGRDLPHDLFQHRFHVLPGFCRNQRGVLGLYADDILNLIDDPLRLRAGQIDLVDHRKYIQIVIQGQIYICQGLRFNALSRVYHQDGAVAGGQAPGNFIIEIHMARGIYHVQNILLSVLGLVNGPDSLSLNGNAALPFQLHIVQHLILHLPLGQQPGHLNNPVCQSGLSMINMRNNTKIPYFTLFYSCQGSFLQFSQITAVSVLRFKLPSIIHKFQPPCKTLFNSQAKGSMAFMASSTVLVWAPTSSSRDRGRTWRLYRYPFR